MMAAVLIFSVPALQVGDGIRTADGGRLESNAALSSSPVARALRQIRRAVSEATTVATCPEPLFVDSGKETYQIVWPVQATVSSWGRKHRYGGRYPFSCTGAVAWNNSDRALSSCGDDIMRFMHPFIWECRLKERLIAELESAGLADCAYGFLDLGAALGDWVVALSGRHPSAQFAAAEANPETVVSLLRNYHANGLLDAGRVHLYPFAVGATNATSGDNQEWRWADVIWPEYKRIFIRVLNWPGSTLCMPIQSERNLGGFATAGLSEEGSSGCKASETKVPIVSIVDLMNDWQRAENFGDGSGGLHFGGLFAVKVDVEGAEASVVESFVDVYTDTRQRPCIMYFELKRNEAYENAFHALLELGYREVLDVDSGRTGKGSYPPVGRLYSKEGNYEFKLPPAEFKECVARVNRATCH